MFWRIFAVFLCKTSH